MGSLKLVLGSLEIHRKTKLNCLRVQEVLYLEFQLSAWATIIKFIWPLAATSPKITIWIQNFHSVLGLGFSRPSALENEVGVMWEIISFHFVEQNVREMGLMPSPNKLTGEWPWQIWVRAVTGPQSAMNCELARAVLCAIQQLSFAEEAAEQNGMTCTDCFLLVLPTFLLWQLLAVQSEEQQNILYWRGLNIGQRKWGHIPSVCGEELHG